MIAACIMGLRYYAIVFGLAFAMGVARTLVIAPRLGATVAVLLEVPLIVAASWVTVRHLLRHCALTFPQSAAMGAVAFTLTMGSEVILARLLRGQSVIAWAADVMTPLGLIGLAGQIAFAVMPVLVIQHRNSLRIRA